jgi:hypothetical protein
LARKPANVKNDYQRVEGHQITTQRGIAQILIGTKIKGALHSCQCSAQANEENSDGKPPTKLFARYSDDGLMLRRADCLRGLNNPAI